MLSLKQMTYVTLAIAFAALMVMVYETNNQHTAPKQVMVLVASQTLPAGTAIELNQLQWQAIEQGDFNREVGLITKEKFSTSEFKKSVLARPIKVGEYIYSDDFITPDDSDYLTTILGKDKRAVAISVNSQSAIAGLVQPGDWVDVMFYHVLSRRAEQDAWKVAVSSTSRQLVSNVRLLAVDRAVTPVTGSSRGGKGYTPHSTVTLEVDTQQAQQLYLAQKLGDLSLMLRAKDAVDDHISKQTTQMADLLGQYSDETEQANMVLYKGNVQVMPSASAKNKETKK